MMLNLRRGVNGCVQRTIILWVPVSSACSCMALGSYSIHTRFFVDIITFMKTESAQHMFVFFLTASHFYDLTFFFETFPFTLTCRINLPDGIPCLVVFKDRLRTLLFRRNTVAMRKKHIADAVTFWTAFCKLRLHNLFKQQAHLAQSLYRGWSWFPCTCFSWFFSTRNLRC
jgi:hypothetical protein